MFRSGRATKSTIAWVSVGVVALSVVVLALLATRHGPQVTNDSADYLAAARNLSAGHGYTSYDRQALTLFPPGFSLTLAGVDRVGIEPVQGARWLNAFAFAALVVLTFVLTRRHVRREWLAVASAAAVGFSTSMLNTYTDIWSEPVFCVAALGLLLVLELLMARRGRGIALAIAAGALASVGFAYRYAGHTLLVLPIVVITVAAWRDGIVAVIRRLLPYVATAVIVPGLIVARNLSEGSSAFGHRVGPSESLRRVVDDTMQTLREWVTGGISVPAALGSLIVVALAAVTVAGLVVVIRRPHSGASAPPNSLLPLLAFTGIYGAYLVVSEMSTAINNITTRLLSPVFAPLVVLLFIAVDALLGLEVVRRQQWVVTATAVVVVLVLGTFAVKAARHSQFVNRSGEQGTAPRASNDPQLVAALAALPSGTPVYSNDPVNLYFATAGQPISFPYPGFPRADDTRYRTADGRASTRPTVLAWREPNPKPAIAGPDQLRKDGLKVASVATTGVWTVYRITK